MKNTRSGQTGLISVVILVVVAFVLLKYIYDIDVVGFLTEGKPREILDKIYEIGSEGWNRYGYILRKIWDYIAEFIKEHI